MSIQHDRYESNLELRSMKQEVQYLLEVVKYILNKQQGVAPIPAKDMDWEALIKLAKNHSILNLVHYAVDKLPEEHKPDTDRCKHLYQASVNAIVRNYNQIEGIKEIFQKFEEEGIYVFAVKGICTKNYYPQTDMRTMGDIDLLYRPEQNAKVKKAMLGLGYDLSMEGRKHDIYSRSPYMAVEMHRELIAAESIYNSYYEDVWERVKEKENYQYVKEMSVEDEYIYSMIHLARHFQDGGIGIRFIMDVYVYNHIEQLDWSYIEAELKKVQLWEFYGNVSRLAEIWFGNQTEVKVEDNQLFSELATYIISNGTFGSARNAAAVSSTGKGRLQALMNEVFPSLKSMQSMYEWLKKYPVLLPYAWALRGVRSVTSQRRRMNIKYHMDKYKNADKEYGEQLQRFFEACGL